MIRGYRAMLDGAAVGCGFQPFVTVVMRHEDRATVAEFEQRVAELPEVVEAHRLFGDPDYLLKIAVADVAAYERFITDVLSGLPGIAQVNSLMTMKRVKEDTGLPVRPAAGSRG
ncbi:Lrp/AsnC family transcriptional regulator [Kitasatospora arboriphila]